MPLNTRTSCQVREQPPKASSSRQLRPHMPSLWASRSPGSAPRPLPALARQDGGRPEVPEQRRDRRLQQERTCCGYVKSDLTHLDEQPCHEPLKPQRPYDTGQGARHVGTHVGVVCLEDFVEELQISLERHLHHRQLKVARRSAGLDPGSLHTSAIVMATQEPSASSTLLVSPMVDASRSRIVERLSCPISISFPPAIMRRRFPSRVRPEAEQMSQAKGQAENGT